MRKARKSYKEVMTKKRSSEFSTSRNCKIPNKRSFLHFSAKCAVVNFSQNMLWLKGPSIYDVHKKIRFLTPSPCSHASTWAGPLPPCGRPHAVDMKYTSFS